MEFSTTLQRWYAVHGRTLPWRGISEPYRIWLSEVILQQTRVEQGRAYYERFTREFPTVEALAAATEREVLAAWQGLGYYTRARNLHKAAKAIAAAGAFPNTYEALRALPGVGDYTASAVASLAYGLPYAVVDGNVYRVLARYFGLSTPIDTTAGKHEFKALATRLLDPQHSAEHNQAMMDLGATVCTPRTPRCTDCPLSDGCVMLAEGCNPEQFPFKARRIQVSVRHFTYVMLHRQGQWLLHRRQAGDIWQGLYEPLLFESDQPFSPDEVQQSLQRTLAIGPHEGTFRQVATGMRHQLTHRLILAEAYLLDLGDAPTTLPEGCVWVSDEELAEYPVPRLVEHLFSIATETLQTSHNHTTDDTQKETATPA